MAEHHDPLKATEDTWRGRSTGADANLAAAIKDAWNEAKKGGGPDTLRVVDIYIAGNNPITEYSVIVGRGI
jgi:hypothetical protein